MIWLILGCVGILFVLISGRVFKKIETSEWLIELFIVLFIVSSVISLYGIITIIEHTCPIFTRQTIESYKLEYHKCNTYLTLLEKEDEIFIKDLNAITPDINDYNKEVNKAQNRKGKWYWYGTYYNELSTMPLIEPQWYFTSNKLIN